MNQINRNDLKELVLNILEPKLMSFNLEKTQLKDDFHFLDSGVMDSFGVVELVGQIQEKVSFEVDFSDFDPQEFVTLGGLVDALLRSNKS